MREWLTRDEALAALGVRAQTLYAYASRGLLERRADTDDPRRSLYRAEDIAALTGRRARGRRPAAIAASAIAWGEPALRTAISTVVHGRLIYCGRDAATLSDHATLEEVAALLWQTDAPPVLADDGAAGDAWQALATLAATARATAGRPVAKLAADATVATAALARAMGAHGDGAVHDRLARHWRVDPAGALLIRRALVLLADHELNPSTFAARVAASTGASIAACLLAGLATLSGPRHGGAGAATAALAAEAARDGTEAAIARWLAATPLLPGFGHPLYPHGDPRAAALLAQVTVDAPLATLRDVVAETTGALPNIDFALLAVTRTLGLPGDAPFRLFATARATGWAAHAIEQAATGGIIRPRGSYVGPPPEGTPARRQRSEQ